MSASILFATDSRGRQRQFTFDPAAYAAVRALWYDAKDDARYSGFRGWLGPLDDKDTGESVWIRPAPCGGGCYCAANYRTTTPRTDQQYAIITEDNA